MTNKPNVAELPEAVVDAFWASVEKTAGTGCWEWRGNRTHEGYGRFMRNYKAYAAHRVGFELHKGAIPRGLVIDHMCRNRGCVNPEHLRAVPNGQNVLENSMGFAAANAAMTHCKRGHSLSGSNLIPYPLKRGMRSCRECERLRNKTDAARERNREKQRAYRARKRARLSEYPNGAG